MATIDNGVMVPVEDVRVGEWVVHWISGRYRKVQHVERVMGENGEWVKLWCGPPKGRTYMVRKVGDLIKVKR